MLHALHSQFLGDDKHVQRDGVARCSGTGDQVELGRVGKHRLGDERLACGD
jgi:hypothetical protein